MSELIIDEVFSGKLINTESDVSFHAGNKEVMRITSSGHFFVGDEEVKSNEEIRDLFVTWIKRHQ